MMRRTIFAVLGFLAIGPAHAQQPSAACKLLQVAEIESALGGKASGSPSGSSQSAPGSMDIDTCSMKISLPGKGAMRIVRMHVVTKLPMDGGEAVRTRNAGQAREAQWKTAGARFEQKTVGNALCVMSGRPGVAGHTTCAIPRGKGYVEIDVNAPDVELESMDVVGALAQKAASRL